MFNHKSLIRKSQNVIIKNRLLLYNLSFPHWMLAFMSTIVALGSPSKNSIS